MGMVTHCIVRIRGRRPAFNAEEDRHRPLCGDRMQGVKI